MVFSNVFLFLVFLCHRKMYTKKQEYLVTREKLDLKDFRNSVKCGLKVNSVNLYKYLRVCWFREKLCYGVGTREITSYCLYNRIGLLKVLSMIVIEGNRRNKEMGYRGVVTIRTKRKIRESFNQLYHI